MAVTNSGLYVDTFKDILTAVSQTGTGGLNLTLATWKIALYSNSITPNFSQVDAAYSSTNEVSGTGWAAGGVLLSAAAAGGTSTAPTLAEGTTGSLRYDMGDIAVSTTTLTNARCCLIYADPITAPVADPSIILVNFGADYSTVAGTFGIQWSATGLSELDLTP